MNYNEILQFLNEMQLYQHTCMKDIWYECQVMQSICKRYDTITICCYVSDSFKRQSYHNTYAITYDNSLEIFKLLHDHGNGWSVTHRLTWDRLIPHHHTIKNIMIAVEDYLKIPLPDIWYGTIEKLEKIDRMTNP